MNSKTTPADLSYFRLSLLAFLKESHPMLSQDEKFISARVETALHTYEQAIKRGNYPFEAEHLANEILFLGLHFSKHDILINILWNEFYHEIPEENAKALAVKLLPECEPVFAKYPLADNFAYSPEYDLLYIELTGTIALFIESRNP